jgi:DNA polymerase-1
VTKTVLLDASNLAMRAWHAASHTGMSAEGEATGPLVIFISSLARLIGEERPSHFVACWDTGGSAAREKLWPGYKLSRRQAALGEQAHAESFRLIKKFLSLSDLPQWFHPGVEADDLIAAAHRRTEGAKVILSSDKDLLQLLDHETEQVRFTGTVKPERWDHGRVYREYRCRPEHLGKVMALSGDAADGVPGLAGIGPKRAVKLLVGHEWDWDALLDTFSSDQRATAELCRGLVDLSYLDEPVPSVPPWTAYPRHTAGLPFPDPVRHPPLLEFCDRFRLSVLRARIENSTLWW